MNRLAEYFSAAADVAPLEVRPAWAVMAASVQDTLDRVRDPALGDRPGRVTLEQIAAANGILAAEENS